MKDQIIAAFKKAEIELPEEVQHALEEEALNKKAEAIYKNTKIESPDTMVRDMAAKHSRLLGDVVLEKLLRKLGIEDAEIVTARTREKLLLLSELRGHDALVRMINKIAASTGIIQYNPETSPTSTLHALKLGVSLQHVYGSLMTRALEMTSREDALKNTINSQQREIDRLRERVGYVDRVNFQVEKDAAEKVSVISEYSKFLHIHATDPNTEEMGWVYWKTNESGPFEFSDLPSISRIKLTKNIRKAAAFKPDEVNLVVDRLNRSVLSRKFAAPGTIGVSRIVVSEVE